ncbi:DUF2252 domain-containing protein [Nocardia veterana]|uniref:DUF2252 domain-containing protein n=1 Tax=Nocardia veterana TaxID=132249 RepID=A0A7X6RG58_9NOCA|nr:DUF2252 domain-containing protein [Nocardia veterana]NKY84696.1 DUF2252 domain-containing protein [Nocardia veterana]
MANALVDGNSSTASPAGRAVRATVPRSSLGEFRPAPDRDPIAILQREDATRVPDLVPIRYARMATGQFSFLRGAPAIMAADLATLPHTGLTVQLCGDAHLSNFGIFASPERSLVFDLDDFDETLPGPFEWDVKRLVASVAVAAGEKGFPAEEATVAARTAATAYRECMRRLAGMDALDIWYEQVDEETVANMVSRPQFRASVDRAFGAARKRTSLDALNKLTYTDEQGVLRIRHRPPLVTPVDYVDAQTVEEVFTAYHRSLPEERRVLAERYRIVDYAHKVGGVGSVGTRCYVILTVDRDTGGPLFLQMKEAERSVLEPYLAPSSFQHQGHRVVHGQRLLQTSSDIFLGWVSGPNDRNYYFRQLRDMKGGADITQMSKAALRDYAGICGHTLARAHARSGDRIAIADYLGGGAAFEKAMTRFALAYAERTAADYRELLRAIDSGRVQAAAAGS